MPRGNVRGDTELVKALRALSKGPAARDVDGMATRSFTPVLTDARARMKAIRNYPSKYSSFFPKQRGPFGKHLDRFIVLRKDGKQAQGRRAYKIGGVNRARFLLHLIEWGSAPHVQPNLRFNHPGATPRPVMTPAYEAGHPGVIRDMGFEFADWLLRAGRAQGLRITRGKTMRFT